MLGQRLSPRAFLLERLMHATHATRLFLSKCLGFQISSNFFPQTSQGGCWHSRHRLYLWLYGSLSKSLGSFSCLHSLHMICLFMQAVQRFANPWCLIRGKLCNGSFCLQLEHSFFCLQFGHIISSHVDVCLSDFTATFNFFMDLNGTPSLQEARIVSNSSLNNDPSSRSPAITSHGAFSKRSFKR